MTFDLVVTISMHFYERCQTKEIFEISDFRRREILHLRPVCLFLHQFKTIPVKRIYVGFCPSGLLSQGAFVLVGFCPVGFCPSGLLF